LPARAQFSPVFTILVTDISGTGKKDLFLGGNFYGVKPEIGRYDANYGTVMLNKGNRRFEFMPPAASGLFITGEVRDAAMIENKNGKSIIIARNNDALQLYKKVK